MTKIETFIFYFVILLNLLLSQSNCEDEKDNFNTRKIESTPENRGRKESGQDFLNMDITFCFSRPSLLEEFKDQLMSNFQSLENFQIYSMEMFDDCIERWAVLEKNVDEKETRNKIPSTSSRHFVQFAFISKRMDELLEMVTKIVLIQKSKIEKNESLWLPSALIVLITEDRNDFAQNADKHILEISGNFSHFEIPINSQVFFTVLSTSSSSSSFSFFHGSWDIWEIYHANFKLFVNKLSSHIENTARKQANIFTVLIEILGKIFITQNISTRRHLNGFPVKVGGIKTLSNVVDINLHRLNTTHVEFVSGFSVAFLWDLRDALNFSVVGIWAEHYIWSREINGIGKQVLEGEIDFSIACHTIFPYRAENLQFLQPIRPENVKAYFRQPPSYALRNLFTFPFNNWVWIAYGIACVIIMISFIFLERVSSRAFKKLNNTVQEDGKKLHNVIFESISIFLFQSLPQEDQNNSVLSRKILILTGFLLGVVMLSVYSSAIISALTVQLTPVYDFKHFLQYGYIFMSDEFIQRFYRAISGYPESKKLLEDSSQHFGNYATGFRKVMGDDWNSGAETGTETGSGSDVLYVLVLPSHTFNYNAAVLNYTEERICQLETIQFGPKNGNVAMFMKKGSPLKEFFATKTALFIERGLRNHHLAQYQRSAEPCATTKEKSTRSSFKGISSFPQVQLKDSMLAFEILGAGGISCLAVFLMERIYELRKRL